MYREAVAGTEALSSIRNRLCVTAVTVGPAVRFILLIAKVECCMWWERRFKVRALEDISQQVNSGIAAWMECVRVNIIWKILHNRWTVEFQFEWSVLQSTLSGRYFKKVGHWYCGLIDVC